MKKLLSVIALVLLSVLVLTACNTDEYTITLNDGTYRAEFADFDSFGWKDYVELTIENGELSEVVFDAVNDDGTKFKSEDEAYKNDMNAIVGTYPAKYNKALIDQFLKSGKVTAVDIVAGATESTGNFKTLITAALQSAIDGNTEAVIVENYKK